MFGHVVTISFYEAQHVRHHARTSANLMEKHDKHFSHVNDPASDAWTTHLPTHPHTETRTQTCARVHTFSHRVVVLLGIQATLLGKSLPSCPLFPRRSRVALILGLNVALWELTVCLSLWLNSWHVKRHVDNFKGTFTISYQTADLTDWFCGSTTDRGRRCFPSFGTSQLSACVIGCLFAPSGVL